jgi:hypothetical protein
MVSKMDEQRKCKNVNKEEGRLRNKLKGPQSKLRRNILRAYFTKSFNFKRKYLTI